MSESKQPLKGKGTEPSIAPSTEPRQSQMAPAPEIEPSVRPDDFYMQGPYVVFTAAYHLRRGYCCNSDCRHCPYK